MKKTIVLLLALALLLTGCGSTAKNESAMDYGYAVTEAATEVMMESGSGIYSNGTAPQASPQENQKLVVTMNMEAETEDLDAILPQLTQRVSELGGYMEQQEVYNGSSYSNYRYRNAYMTIRIPAENLDGFVDHVTGLTNIISSSKSQEDVTLTYVATESRMNALKVEEERLIALLAQAENVSDLLEIEARLGDVRGELEAITSHMRVLENQVSYATVHLDISEVREYTPVEEQTTWQKIAAGFSRNLKNIGEDLVDFFVWVVTYSPQLIVFAAVITAAVFLLKKRRKVKKAPRQPKETENEE